MSSSMRNFMEAYAAVHNTEAKEELTSKRDLVSEMTLTHLKDEDLCEIVEEVLESVFEEGVSVKEAHQIFSGMFESSDIVGRQEKITRLNEAVEKTFSVVKSKAAALEEFAKYRNNKKLQETWSDRFNQDKRIEKLHSSVVAAESKNVKEILSQIYELYKGKHGQSDKEYQDGRSDAGKRISGDSKEGPASYSTRIHKNSAPTAPGKKPKNVPGLSKGEKAELQMRKANLKKESVAFSEAELQAFESIVNSWED